MKLRALPNRLRRRQQEPQRKPTLTDVVQIVANIGVIASIVFLAIELHQNNEVLNAQARHERAQTRIDGLTDLTNNPDLIRARLQDAGSFALSAEERLLLDASWEILLTRWQYVYGELQAGLIDVDDIPIDFWKQYIRTYPSFPATWERTKNAAYRRDFVQWLDTNVMGPALAERSAGQGLSAAAPPVQ